MKHLQMRVEQEMRSFNAIRQSCIDRKPRRICWAAKDGNTRYSGYLFWLSANRCLLKKHGSRPIYLTYLEALQKAINGDLYICEWHKVEVPIYYKDGNFLPCKKNTGGFSW